MYVITCIKCIVILSSDLPSGIVRPKFYERKTTEMRGLL